MPRISRQFRPFGRRPQRRPAVRGALRRLRRAHAILAEGKSREAAEIFEDLANRGAQRGAGQAPLLFLQAGRAWLDSGDKERAIDLLKRGLLDLARRGQIPRLTARTARVIRELNAQGMELEAKEIESEIREAYPALDLQAAQGRRAVRRGQLPGACPNCGGPVRPDEIDWNDDLSAYCDYCGILLEAKA